MFKSYRKPEETVNDFNIVGLSIIGLNSVLIDMLNYQLFSDEKYPFVSSAIEVTMELESVTS